MVLDLLQRIIINPLVREFKEWRFFDPIIKYLYFRQIIGHMGIEDTYNLIDEPFSKE